MNKLRVLISGGPGSGCTSTAIALGQFLGLPVFDSDHYFHKPSDPPFQEQRSPEERREMLTADLARSSGWILAGSVATWELDPLALEVTHGVLLKTPVEMRLRRLEMRQREQFGTRIDPQGDMHDEHQSFLKWAADYEKGANSGRNLKTDRAFLKKQARPLLELSQEQPMKMMIMIITIFLEK